jgi:hypothetical protein
MGSNLPGFQCDLSYQELENMCKFVCVILSMSSRIALNDGKS